MNKQGGSRDLYRSGVNPVVAVLTVLTLVVAGTWFGDYLEQAPRRRADDICAQIQAGLARRDDVVFAEVWYANDQALPGYAAAVLRVRPGAELGPVVDAVTGAIWRSKLSPLRTIDVQAWEDGNPDRWVSPEFAADGGDKAMLRAWYGPRPVG